ncbi:MAG: hypothetical protein U9N02_04355 [Campylobacterota bacterium]|nr:hypothetical protein [Campylobacterota bacterium]
MDKKVYLIFIVLGVILVLVYFSVFYNKVDTKVSNVAVENVSIAKEQIDVPIEPVKVLQTKVQKSNYVEEPSNQTKQEINTTEFLLIDKIDNLKQYQLQLISHKKINSSKNNDAYFKVIINKNTKLSFRLDVNITNNLDSVIFKVIDLKENKTFIFDHTLLSYIRKDFFYEIVIDTTKESFYIYEKENISRFKTIDTEKINRAIEEEYEFLNKPMPISF